MHELDRFNPLTLGRDQVAALRAMMREAFPVLRSAAAEKYQFGNNRKLRDDYKSGKLTLWWHPTAKRHMERLIAAEPVVMPSAETMAALSARTGLASIFGI